MDRDEYRRTSLENWETMAAGWERRRASIESGSAAVAEWLIRELAPQQGQTILELAAGPGDTGFLAAPLVGEEGRVISTDFSPEMVEVARRRGEELGLTNVDNVRMDAERLELEDDSVDGVICRFGYMLMADTAAALRETRRVLRPGGRVVLAAWRGPENNPWVALAGRILVARGLAPPNDPDPDAPGMFTMSQDERVRSLLEGAGFADVRIDSVPTMLRAADVDDYVSTVRDTGGVFARAWEAASEDDRVAIKEELAEAFVPFGRDGRLELPGLALVAVAS
jgi:ubiquinone/menaquinone biosynthesis C-methylase UbiE